MKDLLLIGLSAVFMVLNPIAWKLGIMSKWFSFYGLCLGGACLMMFAIMAILKEVSHGK